MDKNGGEQYLQDLKRHYNRGLLAKLVTDLVSAALVLGWLFVTAPLVAVLTLATPPSVRVVGLLAFMAFWFASAWAIVFLTGFFDWMKMKVAFLFKVGEEPELSDY